MKALRIISILGAGTLLTSLACNDATAPTKGFRHPNARQTCGNMERPALQKGSTSSPPTLPSQSLSPKQIKPQHGFDPNDECVAAEDVQEHSQLLQEFAGTQTSDMDTWYGGDIAWPAQGTGTECPTVMPIMRIRQYVPAYGDYATFTIMSSPDNPVTKIEELGLNGDGYETARYQLPEMIFNSTDGKYSIYGGTISVACYHKAWWVWGANLALDVQMTLTWGYQGMYGAQNPIRRNQVSIIGGDAGWAYSYSDGSSNGFGASWSDALDTYVSGGRCTVGWAIFVDGVQKCDIEGRQVNQT